LRDIHAAQVQLEQALDKSGLRVYCKSQLNLVKMHDLTHHIMYIMLFERPMLYSTQAGERLNGRKIKVPYQRGNKKDNEEFVSSTHQLLHNTVPP
jgi:hypothetical protein